MIAFSYRFHFCTLKCSKTIKTSEGKILSDFSFFIVYKILSLLLSGTNSFSRGFFPLTPFSTLNRLRKFVFVSVFGRLNVSDKRNYTKTH